MKLSQILSQIKSEFKVISGKELLDEIAIENITIDSRLVTKNSAFFALVGKTVDGAQFIDSAIKNGANLVVSSVALELDKNVVLIVSKNPFELLVEFLKIFYSPLPENIYAITGTNGKTSVAEFSRQILQFLGKKSASIGTLGINCDDEIKSQLQDSSLTTPDIVSLYKNLSLLKKNQVNDVAIEVSSIGLEQGRIAGLKINVGSFTNFTQDHLDYHGSMEQYFDCKMILFKSILKENSSAILNADIVEFPKIKKICEEKQHRVIEYGFKAKDLHLQKIETLDFGQRIYFQFRKKIYQFDLSINGDFQAFNALCALGNILANHELTDINLTDLLKNFHLLKPALGRMQRVATLPNKAQIFIDFAHSPDALENLLKLSKTIAKARVLVLFGCGGDRDGSKRPKMAKIACDFADFVIVTDDNPRCENPAQIRKEILNSCDMSKTLEIDGRKTAIEKAITMLEANDILILAGKGHEKYQIIGEIKNKFDEEEIVRNAIANTFKN